MGVTSSMLVSSAQSFLREVEARRVEVEGQVRDMKGSFRAREASIGEAVDRVNALAQRAMEGARLKREQVARNEAEMARVEGEVSFLVVNTNAVREAQENVDDLTQVRKRVQMGSCPVLSCLFLFLDQDLHL